MNFFSTFVFTLILCALSPLHAKTIVIDPGHGGTDLGAVRGGVREKEISLQVSRYLKEKLEDLGYSAPLTRQNDSNLKLNERAEKALQLASDIFVSVHANSSLDTRARGVEFYFQNQMTADEESMFLASKENQESEAQGKWPKTPFTSPFKLNADVKYIIEDLARNHRVALSGKLAENLYQAWGERKFRISPLRQAPFFLVSQLEVPSVLIELGYVSNPEEASQLSSPSSQRDMAERLARGIDKYLRLFHNKEKVDNSARRSLD